MSGEPLIGNNSGNGEFVIDFSSIDLSDDTNRLLRAEVEEFESVLGRPVAFRPAGPDDDAWLVERPDDRAADEASCSGPTLRWKTPHRLVSVARNEAELFATVNAVHTLARMQSTSVTVTAASSVDDAIELIRNEIAHTYPYFTLRGLDWQSICARHLDGANIDRDNFAEVAATWVAELGDAHTSLKTPESGGANPPYRGVLRADGVHVFDVPRRSAAFAAGVRDGWVIAIDDVDHWVRTVGASPHQLDHVRARRALAFAGPAREFAATDPAGSRTARWIESAVPIGPDNAVFLDRTGPGSTLLRLRAFHSSLDLHGVLDELIATADASDTLILDLRGNTGGSLLLATDVRDRFLRTRTHIGYIAFTDGRGGLAQRRERWADPSERTRWPGKLEVLTDCMTYSAAEDFLLGLQGLGHVIVRGSATGGGSGRPRRIPVLPGVDLTISTAITYDRRGNPVEFHGIQPDITE